MATHVVCVLGRGHDVGHKSFAGHPSPIYRHLHLYSHVRHACVQIREILLTDLDSRRSTGGVNGIEEPETFFNAEDDELDNGNADAPATPDKTGIVTALGTPHPIQTSLSPLEQRALHCELHDRYHPAASPCELQECMHAPCQLPHVETVSGAELCVPAAERSSPQQRRAGTEEASTSARALATRAEPKEAEVVQDEERKDERYNPVMW